MAETITVRAARPDNLVALWERHPDHPGGEVFIAGDGRSHEVALTPAVQAALADGRLVRVDGVGDEATPIPDAPKPAAKPRGKSAGKKEKAT